MKGAGLKMDNSIELLFRETLKSYCDNNDERAEYAVCWYAHIASRLGTNLHNNFSDGDENIYRIRANSRLEAVSLFLANKANRVCYSWEPDFKEKIIKEIVKSTYRLGRMRCLDGNNTLRDFSYEIETVIDGNYYSVNEDSKLDETDARIAAIIENIDCDSVLDLLTPQLFVDVYIEAHLYDVAVMELHHLGL